MAKHEELSNKLEQLAKFYIAADPGDSETISVIAGRLEEISALAEAASFHACAAAAAKAAALFGLSAREAAGGAEAVFAVAGKTISAIQMVVDENRPEADSDFPAELGIIIPEQAETEAIEKIYNALYEFSLITKKSTKDGIYSLVLSSSRILNRILNRILSRRIKDNNLVPYVLGAIISVVDELQNDVNGNDKNVKRENKMPPAQTAQAEEKALRQDDDILRDFFEESAERLDESEEQLLLLEKDISLKEPANIIFRAFHSMKGVSGFLKISDVHAISMEAENILE
jgi:HPt (histidine-containing phosphotransfer) domain-containing protein